MKNFKNKEADMLLGVCSFLSSYFKIDVSIIRVIFATLTFLTSGVMLLVYILLFFMIPNEL